MKQSVLIAVSDLLFQSRIEGAAKSLGLEPVVADTPQRLDDAIAIGPAIAVVDVHETAFSATEAIARATASGVQVLAFGRHTAPAELRGAREAGATIVVPRSELAERLVEYLERLMAASDAGTAHRGHAPL